MGRLRLMLVCRRGRIRRSIGSMSISAGHGREFGSGGDHAPDCASGEPKRDAGFQADRGRKPAKKLPLAAARQNLVPIPANKAFFFCRCCSGPRLLSIVRELAMDSLTIAAASGMRARMESLDMLANNLANADTSGYKTDREFYNLYVSSDAQAAEDSPATLPVVERPWTDFSQGRSAQHRQPARSGVVRKGLFCCGWAVRQPLYPERKLPCLACRPPGYRRRISREGSRRRQVAG